MRKEEAVILMSSSLKRVCNHVFLEEVFGLESHSSMLQRK